MPLFFAIAGLVSAVLALAVLCAPVLVVVLVIAAVRAARSPRPTAGTDGAPCSAGKARSSPTPDAVFADLIADQWPSKAAALQMDGSSGNGSCAT